MTTTSHANCLHPSTKQGRAACRKRRAELVFYPVDAFQAPHKCEAIARDWASRFGTTAECRDGVWGYWASTSMILAA